MKQDIKWLGFRAVVVEAAEKIGILITADFITSLKSSGTNILVKAGAMLIDSPGPILEELLSAYMKAQRLRKKVLNLNLIMTRKERFFFIIVGRPIYR
jgi:predicted Rossmann fold nucleotide-binding protein DprA/Smf involved in DNA uptake